MGLAVAAVVGVVIGVDTLTVAFAVRAVAGVGATSCVAGGRCVGQIGTLFATTVTVIDITGYVDAGAAAVSEACIATEGATAVVAACGGVQWGAGGAIRAAGCGGAAAVLGIALGVDATSVALGGSAWAIVHAGAIGAHWGEGCFRAVVAAGAAVLRIRRCGDAGVPAEFEAGVADLSALTTFAGRVPVFRWWVADLSASAAVLNVSFDLNARFAAFFEAALTFEVAFARRTFCSAIFRRCAGDIATPAVVDVRLGVDAALAASQAPSAAGVRALAIVAN